MSERDSTSPGAGDPGPTASPTPRDFEAAGDVGAESHGAFAGGHDGTPATNDERLGMRGRATGHGEGAFADELDADRAERQGGGAGSGEGSA